MTEIETQAGRSVAVGAILWMISGVLGFFIHPVPAILVGIVGFGFGVFGAIAWVAEGREPGDKL